MKKRFIYILLITVAFIGCGKGAMFNRLEKTDQFLSEEKPDSAYSELDRIKVSDLKNKRDSAYYFLLKTQTLYRLYKPVTSDSMVNSSIRFYEKAGDKEKLARAYFYKGVTIYDLGQTKEALINMKKAETVALHINDTLLIHNIYEALSIFNGFGGEHELAMKYARNTLQWSYKARNKNWEAYALNNISGLFLEMNQKDSALYYANKSIHLLDYIPKSEWIYFLTNIGTSYISKNRKLAKHYLLESLSVHSNPYTYSALATIYASEGKEQEADSCWRMALQTKDLSLKKEVLQAMFDNRYKKQDFKAASDISKQILATAEALSEKRRSEQVRETQSVYEKEMEASRERQLVTNVTILILVFGLSMFLRQVYIKYKSAKVRNQMMQDQMLINSYTAEIERLKASSAHESQKVAELKQKLTDLQTTQSKTLFKGRELYQHLIKRESVITWRKADFTSLIEYYRLLNLPFVIHLEEDYDSLSPKYKLYEIMRHEGMTDEEIAVIMGVSTSTLRVTKTRIKGKKKGENLFHS